MGTVELGGQIYQFTAPSTNYRYLPVAVINCLVFAWMEFAPKAGPVSPPRMRTMEKPVAAAIMRVQSALFAPPPMRPARSILAPAASRQSRASASVSATPSMTARATSRGSSSRSCRTTRRAHKDRRAGCARRRGRAGTSAPRCVSAPKRDPALRKHNIDPQQLLRRAGLSERSFDDPQARVTTLLQARFLAYSAE